MLQARNKQPGEHTKSHRQIKPKKVDGCLVRRRYGGRVRQQRQPA